MYRRCRAENRYMSVKNFPMCLAPLAGEDHFKRAASCHPTSSGRNRGWRPNDFACVARLIELTVLSIDQLLGLICYE